MPRPRPPPTPGNSTDLKAIEKNIQPDLETAFDLPPPALRSPKSLTHTSSKGSAPPSTIPKQRTPPVSPKDKSFASEPRNKRTASGMIKSNGGAEASQLSRNSNPSHGLPPPPSRARKIIQMKPKSTSTQHQPSPDSDASYHPPGSVGTVGTSKANASTAANTSTTSKRKQATASSAAGRKIARKTAHSIIERRRRSKMNEEFGVLKDMIPACEGVEMHKLAILQAGIEYLRYLEGCVAQLKVGKGKAQKNDDEARDMPKALNIVIRDEEYDDEDEEEMDDEQPETAAPYSSHTQPGRQHNTSSIPPSEWQFRDARTGSIASAGSSAYPSPYLHAMPGQGQSEEQPQIKLRPGPSPAAGFGSYSGSLNHVPTGSANPSNPSATPTPTLLSPAFNSIHFSPELTRLPTNDGSRMMQSSTPWMSINSSSQRPSPQMQPLPSPKTAIHLPLPPLSQMTALQLPQAQTSTAGRASVSEESGRDYSNSISIGEISETNGTAEATASAALMMLTTDWRHSVGIGGGVGSGNGQGGAGQGKDRGKGMSVHDLLSS
ncbi:hypothetical protein PV10_08190 [Exophiala mesophila]|uniref:BHLH domain-containing protein n=1 Tax=Exophiala mesophila TaxID=212818 RepID=A0A0D1Z3S5_EXOME|nr:uncharacterized protein PV10_08190 [Exophiala mesophila]KIV88509.1 hypothetical protein PV10_08190 [Exophiala mesophila]